MKGQNFVCKALWVISGSSVLKALFMLYSNEMICKLRVSVGILIEPKSPRCIQLILGKQKRKRLCIALVCISRSVQIRLNCQIWPRINSTFE